MFEEFKLAASAVSIMGYHWHVDEALCAVCIVHGIGEHAGRYDRMAGMFNDAGIAVLGMDLRGHGCSAGTRGHCAPRLEVLKDIDNLLLYAEYLYPGKPLILYGHSMGGNITLDFRIRGRLSGKPCAYIISAPWIGLVNEIPKPVYFAAKAISKVKPDFQISSNINPEHLGNSAIIKSEKRAELVHRKISVETAVEGIETGKALEMGTLRGNGDGKGKPMLLMHGDADKLCSVEKTRNFAARENENCTYIEWEGLFHEIHNGNQEKDGSEVIAAVIAWIKALPALSA